jgi:hypothetical protein
MHFGWNDAFGLESLIDSGGIMPRPQRDGSGGNPFNVGGCSGVPRKTNKRKRKIKIRKMIRSKIKRKRRIRPSNTTSGAAPPRWLERWDPNLSLSLALNPLPNLNLHPSLSLLR